MRIVTALRRAPVSTVAPITLVTAAIVVRLGALFAPRALSLDDGTYGVSIADMREGLTPYHSLFSSQGPLHFPVLALGDAIGLHARNAPRVAPVLSGVVIAVATWAIARRLGSAPRVALVAGLVVATTGSMLWTTGPVSAEGPALAFTVGAIWVAIVHRDSPSGWTAWCCGLLLGAALATKPIMFPAVIVVGYLFREARGSAWWRVAAGAFATWITATIWWGPARVWDQSIVFHFDKRPEGTVWSHLLMIGSTLGTRDLVLIAVVGAGLAAARLAPAPGPPSARPADLTVIVMWIGALTIVLLFERLLLAEHVVMLVVPLALVFALRPPPRRMLVAMLALLAPLQLVLAAGIVWPGGYTGSNARVVAALRQLPEDAQAISDSPGLVWQAGLTTPAMLNDSSNSRISTRRETTRTVALAAAGHDTCAVVIWSFRFGENLPGLRNALRGDGYSLSTKYGHDQELWLKNPCVVPTDR